jgi:hypothetical protein
MDVDVSPADLLVDWDVDVEVEVDSVAEDGELEPVAVSVALALTVINTQAVSELIPFHVFELGGNPYTEKLRLLQ